LYDDELKMPVYHRRLECYEEGIFVYIRDKGSDTNFIVVYNGKGEIEKAFS
jgi:hypothetical protein